jgi:hypothetical protein
MVLPYTSKKGQIYIITAILICIGLLGLILTQRTPPEEEYSFESSFQTIERELPTALFVSQEPSIDIGSVISSFEEYFASNGIDASFFIVLLVNDQITLYSDFSNEAKLLCEQTSREYQMEKGMDKAISYLDFFTATVNTTTMLLTQVNCTVSLSLKEKDPYTYQVVVERTKQPSYVTVAVLEKNNERAIRLIEG